MWLRKKTQNIPTSSTSSRLNPHNKLGKLYAYGIYTMSLRAPTKENVIVLILVDTGGKNKGSRTRLDSELPPKKVQRPAEWEGILGR